MAPAHQYVDIVCAKDTRNMHMGTLCNLLLNLEHDNGSFDSQALSIRELERLHDVRPEMGCVLRFPHRLHEHVLNNNADIRPAEAVSLLAQGVKISLRQVVGRVPQVHLEHVSAGLGLRQWDVNALHTTELQLATHAGALPKCCRAALSALVTKCTAGTRLGLQQWDVDALHTTRHSGRCSS